MAHRRTEHYIILYYIIFALNPLFLFTSYCNFFQMSAYGELIIEVYKYIVLYNYVPVGTSKSAYCPCTMLGSKGNTVHKLSN